MRRRRNPMKDDKCARKARKTSGPRAKCGPLNGDNDFTFAVESQGKVRAAPKDDSGFPGNQVNAAQWAAWVVTGIRLAFTVTPGSSSPRQHLSFAAAISRIAS